MSSCSFRPFVWAGGFIAACLFLTASELRADETKPAATPAANPATAKPADKPAANGTTAAAPRSTAKYESSGSSGESGSSGSDEAKPKHPAFAVLLKDFKHIPGLIPLYQKEGEVMAEISPNHLNKDFIVVISIARGIGEGTLLGGMTWGEDLWQIPQSRRPNSDRRAQCPLHRHQGKPRSPCRRLCLHR